MLKTQQVIVYLINKFLCLTDLETVERCWRTSKDGVCWSAFVRAKRDSNISAPIAIKLSIVAMQSQSEAIKIISSEGKGEKG